MHSFHVSCRSSEPDPCRLKCNRLQPQQVSQQYKVAQVLINAFELFYVMHMSPCIYFHFPL